MILTGSEILNQYRKGNLVIDPFDPELINPNSYNYRLGNHYIEVNAVNPYKTKFDEEEYHIIPHQGLLLEPGKVYLSNTYEIIGSKSFVTSLIGRSSVGRLGLFLEISADLGNLGGAHKWTLELTCVQPIFIYPQMKIGQVSFWLPEGEISFYYLGEYTNHNLPKYSNSKTLFK